MTFCSSSTFLRKEQKMTFCSFLHLLEKQRRKRETSAQSLSPGTQEERETSAQSLSPGTREEGDTPLRRRLSHAREKERHLCADTSRMPGRMHLCADSMPDTVTHTHRCADSMPDTVLSREGYSAQRGRARAGRDTLRREVLAVHRPGYPPCRTVLSYIPSWVHTMLFPLRYPTPVMPAVQRLLRANTDSCRTACY